MNRVALVLACLVCASQGWQVERFEEGKSLTPLAAFLLANNPSLTSTRVNQGHRAMSRASPLVRSGKQTMFSPDERTTAMGMASDCLEEGCPVDLVTDLLSHLKYVKDPSAEVVSAIKDLEKQLGLDKPDKNALELHWCMCLHWS
jgi:hypothetical protein